MFSTRFAAVATTVGSAVGLGNIWRFPYEAGVHGGGAFLICYLAFVMLIGVPVLCAEFCMGRATRSNIVGAYSRLKAGKPGLFAGLLGVVSSLLILSFYSVVAGWTVEYSLASLTGALDFSAADPMGHDRFAVLTGGWRSTLWTLLFLGCNFAIMLGGVTKGIERMSNVLMPVLFLLLILFCVNSFTLSGWRQGVAFIFSPDFSKVNPSMLLGAMGQAFFSLSLGLGGMMTYASYFSKTTRLARTAVTTAVLDSAVAILAGVIIFPAVFTFNLSPEAGPTLVFEVLPYVFSQLPAGRMWATLFFILLFLASLTSTVSMSEIAIAYFSEERRMSRRKATLTCALIAGAGALLCALSFGPAAGFKVCGMTMFNLFDYVASNISLPLGGFICSVFVGWKLRSPFLNRYLQPVTPLTRAYTGYLGFCMRWVCPTAIFLIFLNSIGIL